MILNEDTLKKVEKLADDVVDIPLTPANMVLDKIERPLKGHPLGRKMLKRIYTDPSVQSRELNAKEWAGLMAGGSLATQVPGMLAGDVSAPVVGAITAGNAAKGAMIGPMFTGGKDTLLKSAVLPAGVIALTTPLINRVGNALELGDEIDFMPEARAGAAAGIGSGLWLLRNRKNKDKRYY